MSSKHIHLKMIQGVINRFSHNSFLLKGWSLSLMLAMFVLAVKNSQLLFVYLACFLVIPFWFLDGYYLYQERLFRKLYDRVRKLPKSKIDFSMNTEVVKTDEYTWFKAIISKTLVIFYGVISFLIILVIIGIHLKKGGI